MVQYLRAYFILHAIKWIMCVQEKNEGFSMSQKPKLSSIKIAGDISLAAKKRQQGKVQKIFQGWQKAGFLLPRGSICLSMPSHGYWPAPSGL